MFCDNCGKQLEDGSKFCIYCGASLIDDEVEIPAAPVNQPTQPQMPRPGNQMPQTQMSGQYPGRPQSPPPPTNMGGYSQQPRQGGKGPVIIIVAIIALLMIIGIVVAAIFVVPKFLKKGDPDSSTEATVSTETSESTEISKETEETEKEKTKTGKKDEIKKDGSSTEDEPKEDPREKPTDEAENNFDNKDINNLSDSEAQELADYYSTEEKPNIDSFNWFMDNYLQKYNNVAAGNGSSADVREDIMQGGTEITNPKLLNGGWQMLSAWSPTDPSELCYYFQNVTIKTSGGNITLVVQNDFMYTPSDSGTYDMSAEGKTNYSGEWSDDITNLRSSSGTIDLAYFWQKDGCQFGMGEGMLPDGTEGYIVFQRPQGMSYSQTSSGGDSGDYAGFTMNEVIWMARKYSGAPAVEITEDTSTELVIHCFEEIDDGGGQSHTATTDWLYLDPKTLTGENFSGEKVDLKKYK